MSPTPIILDCDPGHDDMVAILLAAASPAIDLRAITTVAGNGTLDCVTRNARRVCTMAGIRDVPIAAGADRPLRRPLEVATDVHGRSALDGPALPEPDVPLDPRPAHDLIADVLRGADTPVALVAVGPLTNVATVLERHPELTGRIAEIVLMGGSTGRGNRTPSAEFNVWADPEAAAAVFTSGLAVTMVGLDVTHQALATAAVVERLTAPGTCAVALLVDRSLVRCADGFVAVETRGEWTRGATVVDLDHRLGRPANARVALDLDVERFWDLVVDAVAAHGARAP